MKTLTAALLLLSSALCVAQPLSATDVKAATELAKNSGCFTCHSASEKIVGPSYASVAAKYSADKDAVASLVQSIQYGSKGKWGRIPMPPHASLSSDELNTLARWVMGIDK